MTPQASPSGTDLEPWVLVTGAASGIGRAIAQTYAAAGWQVCGLDCQPAPADLSVVGWLTCDLADSLAVEAALKTLCARDWSALISCAGIAGVGSPERVLTVNFFAARRIVEALAPRLRDGGAIVLISSGAGMKWIMHQDFLRPVLDAADAEALALATALCPSAAKAYEISKELLCFYGASICLRQLARGIRSNVISPGGVETPLIADFTQSMGEDAMNFSLSVTGRHGRPQEIADVAFYLSSPQAAWINGADIRVDGGLTGALSAGVADFPGWR